MAVNLPQPLYTGGHQKQRTPAEQILISLATQVPQFAASLLEQHNAKMSPQQEQYNAAKDIAFEQNLQDPTASIRNLVSAGLGNANADPKAVQSALSDAKARAPLERAAREEELKLAQEQADELRAEELKQKNVGLFRRSVLATTRDQSVADAAAGLYRMRVDMPEALPAEAFNSMLTRIVGPDAAEQSLIALRDVQRQSTLQNILKIKQDMQRQTTRDAALNQVAEDFGFDWWVPGLEDVMISALKDKVTSSDPQALFAKIATDLATSWKVDLTGNPVIPHTGAEAVSNAAGIVHQIFPEWNPVITPELQRDADFLATMRNSIEAGLENRRSLSELKAVYLQEAANAGIEAPQAQQYWTELIRTIPNR